MLRDTFHQWAEIRRFNALEPNARSIVFYAEDAASWPHFERMVEELTGRLNRDVCYLTSCKDDPILANECKRLRGFYIGGGSLRTWLFLRLRAGVLVMTMPDLEAFHIKRSRIHPVHYVYVFHSMVSTHMAYRKGAFDHFDTLFCVGPHHVNELQENFAKKNGRHHSFVEHGYSRLDTLLSKNGHGSAPDRTNGPNRLRILVAPSWGNHCLLESHGVDLCRVLLDAGHQLTVRPHPMTAKKTPKAIDALTHHFGRHRSFTMEDDTTSVDSLRHADVMISDWSGAALEYAFGVERPVMFVDVPRKVNNPDYTGFSSEPLEVSIRSKIGEIISPHDLHQLPERVERLHSHSASFRTKIQQARSQAVYNVGASGAGGAKCIAQLADAASASASNQA